LYTCTSLLGRVNGTDHDPEERVKVEEPAPVKKPAKERSIKEMLFITTDDFNSVPA
jgi:hypothetical protein